MKNDSQKMTEKLNSDTIKKISSQIGGEPSIWEVSEIGDGNVNLIFRLDGPQGKILIKQAVPYLRCVGESWPLSMKRNFFEYTALLEHGSHVPHLMPKVFSFDSNSASMMMEFLDDHLILRKGMMKAIKYPFFAEQISDYMSKTLFYTSDLFLTAAAKKEKMKLFCENTDLCKITEDLIFTDPYREAEQNKWTPDLKNLVTKIQKDVALKIAVTEMKGRFLTCNQALIHGDLHSGSIMMGDESIKVIDPEFAFYGPMGFDVGLLLGNFLLSYFSQAGLMEESTMAERQDYENWILEQIESIWSQFQSKFSILWKEQAEGDYLSKNLKNSGGYDEISDGLLKLYLQNLFEDTIRFAGAEMIRRILGLAHVADLDSIPESELRAVCESRALSMARKLLVHHHEIKNIFAVTAMAKSHRQMTGLL